MKKKVFYVVFFLIMAILIIIDININDNYNHLNVLKNKNVLLFGDSLSISGRWSTSFEDVCECDIELYGNRSAGFVNKGKTKKFKGLNLVEMLNKVIDSKTNKQKKQVDYIICGAGINDALTDSSLEEIKENVEKFILLAKKNFPNAKIVLFPIHTFKVLSESSYEKYSEMVNVAKENKVLTTKDFIWWTMTDRSIDKGDRIHLTQQGYDLLGEKIFKFINGRDVIEAKNLTYTVSQNVISNISLIGSGNRVYLNGTIEIKEEFDKKLPLIKIYNLPRFYKKISVKVEDNNKVYDDYIIIEDRLVILENIKNYNNPIISINSSWKVGTDY